MSHKNWIRNPELIRQINNFGGLEFGSCRPMNIDLALEFKNSVNLLGEGKHISAPLSTGERLTLERYASDLSKLKPSISFVYEHDVPPDKEVIVANQLIRQYWWKDEWHTPRHSITVKTFMNSFLDWFK